MPKIVDMEKAHPLIMDSFITAFECVLDQIEEQCVVEQCNNPYWERIETIASRQRAKGLKKYGEGVEMNTDGILKRLEHLEEELVDALMYCEWIKDYLAGGVTNAD